MEMTVSLTDLFLIIAGISIIIIMIFLVPLLVQLRQTARRAERLMDNLNQDLPPILSSVKSTAAETKVLSEHINAKLAETEAIISTVRYAGESLLITSKLIRSALAPAITQIGGISTGIRAFYNVIHRSGSKKTTEE